MYVPKRTKVYRRRDADLGSGTRHRRRHFAAVASISIINPGNASFETPSNVPGG